MPAGPLPSFGGPCPGSPAGGPERDPTEFASYYRYALIDRGTGDVYGTADMHSSSGMYSESTVKIWLAVDYLRAHANPSAGTLERLRRLVECSDDVQGDYFYGQDGGNESIKRMISTCGLADTSYWNGWWSKTQISAYDLARLGLCVVENWIGWLSKTQISAYDLARLGLCVVENWTGIGPTQAGWVSQWMRNAGGENRFGIELALPASESDLIAAKNGWYNHADGWRVHCMGVHPDWALAIETRYPLDYGRGLGEKLCESVTQLALTQLPQHGVVHSQTRVPAY